MISMYNMKHLCKSTEKGNWVDNWDNIEGMKRARGGSWVNISHNQLGNQKARGFSEGEKKLKRSSCVLDCCCLVTKSCLTLCHPMDICPPGSSVHWIFQARILEWVAVSFFRGSSWTRDRTCVSCIGRWILGRWVPRWEPWGKLF